MQDHLLHRFTLVALAGVLACSGGGTGPSASDVPAPPDNEMPGPTVAEVAGNYGAKLFMTTSDGVTTDQIAAGVTLTLALTARGTTTGQLLVPVSAGGNGIPVDLAGTWELTGTTVRFIQAAETFVGRITFVAAPRQLSGEATIGATMFEVALTK
jgi:hypothetical protein